MASEGGFHSHDALGTFRHFTDESGVSAVGTHSENSQCFVLYAAVRDDDEFAFVGDVKGIKPQEVAPRLNGVRHRNRGFPNFNADRGLCGDFV